MAFLDSQGVSKLCALLKDKFDSLWTAVNGKQGTLTAGSNITISNGVISATDTNTTYTAGTGISIDSNNEISCIVSGGSSYTAGDGIDIDANSVISNTKQSTFPFSFLSNILPAYNAYTISAQGMTWNQFLENLRAGKVVSTMNVSADWINVGSKQLDAASVAGDANAKYYVVNLSSEPANNFSSNSSRALTGYAYYFDGIVLYMWNGGKQWSDWINVSWGGQSAKLKTVLSTLYNNQLPTDPSTDGSYKLTSTITSGTPTYSWEADSGSSGSSTETIYPGNINSVPYGLFWDGSNILAFQEGPAQNQENLPYFKISDMSQLNEGFAALRNGNLVQFYQSTTINLQDYVEQIFGPQADVPTWNSCLMMWFQSVNGVMQFDVNGAQIYDSQTNTINRTVSSGTFAIKIGRIVYVFMNTRRAAALEWLRNFYNIPILSSNSTSLPAAPSADGNYILKCSVSSGTPTYSWESVTIGGSY